MKSIPLAGAPPSVNSSIIGAAPFKRENASHVNLCVEQFWKKYFLNL